MFVAAANPCPCGYYGEGSRCTCTPSRRISHLSKLSGPIMDRIDVQLFLRKVDPKKLVQWKKAEPSAAVAARVLAAREIQRKRFEGEGIFTNSAMTNKHLEKKPTNAPAKAAANTTSSPLSGRYIMLR